MGGFENNLGVCDYDAGSTMSGMRESAEALVPRLM